MSQLVNLG